MRDPRDQLFSVCVLVLLGSFTVVSGLAGAPSVLVWLLVIAFAASSFFLFVYETPKARQQRQVLEKQRAEEQAATVRAFEPLDRLNSRVADGNAVGEAHDGYVSGVVEYGAFVEFNFFSEFDGRREPYPTGGFVERSELSWRRRTEIDPGTVVTVGERVRVLLMAVEENRRGEPRFWVVPPDVGDGRHRDSHRYRLSIRRAAWPEAVDRYQVGQIVPAVVTEVQREFALLKLPGPVLGRANRTDVSGHHRHGGRMEDVIAEGDVVPVKVTFVNHAFFRLNVSYREARSEISAEGSWVFDQRGRVMQVPAEASEAFPDECAAIEARYAARRELSIRPPF